MTWSTLDLLPIGPPERPLRHLHKQHDIDVGIKTGVSRGAAKFIFESETQYVFGTHEFTMAQEHQNATHNFKGDVRYSSAFGNLLCVACFPDVPILLKNSGTSRRDATTESVPSLL